MTKVTYRVRRARAKGLRTEPLRLMSLRKAMQMLVNAHRGAHRVCIELAEKGSMIRSWSPVHRGLIEIAGDGGERLEEAINVLNKLHPCACHDFGDVLLLELQGKNLTQLRASFGPASTECAA